jgi:NOL1/NOP2/fmu family ribosome biogenesis protein
VYSTCTFAPQENEEAVAAFLASHPEFEPEQVEGPWFTPGENGSFRMWPHKLLGEGHFAAVLRRKGDEASQGTLEQGQKLPQQWLSFAKELDIPLPEGKAIVFGQSLYWAPEELPALQGLKVLRPGLELGEAKKDRLEPAHGLALWLRSCRNVQELSGDSREVAAYMSGDVIPSEKKGWCLVTVDGYSLGWERETVGF